MADYYDTIVQYIDSIEYYINKLKLSSEVYGYKELNQRLGNLQRDETFNSEISNFRNRYYRQADNKPAMIILCEPKDFAGKSVIWIREPMTGLSGLIRLNKKLPYLKVSQCEYASDIFTDDPKILHHILSDVLYLSDAKDFIENGGKGRQDDMCDRIRLVFTVNRQELQDVGVVSLSDLIHYPNFFRLLKDRFKSARFRKRELLPRSRQVKT